MFLLRLHEVVLSLKERLGSLAQTATSRIHRRCRRVNGLFGSLDLVEAIELSINY